MFGILLYFIYFFLQFIKTDSRVLSYVGDLEAYLDVNPINIVGTWATEEDIFSTALKLGTNIYVYSDYYKLQQLFGKNGTYQEVVKSNENCLYVSHVNCNH